MISIRFVKLLIHLNLISGRYHLFQSDSRPHRERNEIIENVGTHQDLKTH